MSTLVTFTVFSNSGAFVSDISLTGQIVYGSDFYSEVLNQKVVTMSDGNRVTYGNATLEYFGKLIIKSVNRSEAVAFKKFGEGVTLYQGNYIGIETNNSLIDLGAGPGAVLDFDNKCKCSMSDGKSLVQLKPPYLADLQFKYRFKNQ